MATAKPKTTTPKITTPSTTRTKTTSKSGRAEKAAATPTKTPPAKRAAVTTAPSSTRAAGAKATATSETKQRKTATKTAKGSGSSPVEPAAPAARKSAKKGPGIASGKKVTKRGAASDDAPSTKPVVAGDLQVGSKAPPFELLGDDGKRHGLASYKGKRFVLYFYPKDDTPGCTKEACQFSELPGFETLGVPVLGVSADSVESHKKFRAKYGLTVGLLSDPGNTVALQYGAYGEKVMYGKRVVGTKRSTFLIGADGRIERIWRNVRADGHAAEVFAALAR